MTETIPSILFYFLAAAVIFPFVPLRWSILSYFFITQFNLVDANFASATSVGIENAIKTLFLPTVLLFRTRFRSIPLLRKNIAIYLWLIAWFYVAFAGLWSPFQLSALKQAGFFYGYTVLFLVLYTAYLEDQEWMDQILVWSLWFGLILGVFQSSLLGNPFGGPERRFTSLTAPQNYALFLVLTLALIIISYTRQKRPIGWLIVLFPVLALVIYLNGSRIGLLSLALLAAYFGLFWALTDHKYTRPFIFLTLTTMVIVLLLAITLVPDLVPENFQQALISSRSFEVLRVLDQPGGLSDITTFNFRVNMYQLILAKIKSRSTGALLVGGGTSSVGELVTSGLIYYRGFNEYNIDANRIAHNEYLRVIYEWGLIGTIIFALFLGAILWNTLRAVYMRNSISRVMLLAAFLILMLFMGFENVLAASGSPGGLAVTLVFVELACLKRPSSQPSSQAAGVHESPPLIPIPFSR